ncbi:FAD dependent oxidoreductase [Limtongia smithiae]|uniref:FAD dependent oxidoreductase n=1 Tax=Limtongia smithiae TaxID=1125753 RepID=UPI0034CE3109
MSDRPTATAPPSTPSTTTIIVGGGIIGLSTAFYLATTTRMLGDPDPARHRIIVVDTSRRLFTCASGRAAGFISRSWFSSATASLAELSFVLHTELAEIFDGATKWGYRPSQAWSVAMTGDRLTDDDYFRLKEERLRSRQTMADDTGTHRETYDSLNEEQKVFAKEPDPPDWLFCDREDTFQISDSGDCAQINPYSLCHFLLDQCKEHGVEIYNPFQLQKVNIERDGKISTAVLCDMYTDDLHVIPNVDNIVIAAGAWSPNVFRTVFPGTKYLPAITSLAGFSMTLASPLSPYNGPAYGEVAVLDSPGSSNSDINVDMYGNGNTTNPFVAQQNYSRTRDALFVRSSITNRWSPEIFSRSNGEIYIAGLNEQGYHPSLSSMAPKSYANDSSSTDDSDTEGQPQTRPYMDNFAVLKNMAMSVLGPELKVIRKSVCLRPVTPRGDPIIGHVPPEAICGARGVYISSGHGPWGISLCLGSGKVIAELLSEGSVRSADISRLAPL